ncbi:hypothetical protein SAMN05443245_0436 [Paraburkholderia fungorum]|uniref:Uncharacterized protein n=1 Tax=Paraburkholderia fungorum TaxID=134537 RepID=A0A1H0Z408_9BURK|nr:hypothetical protein SAMN05443245_0436 [Paraburkholderia fungorum]
MKPSRVTAQMLEITELVVSRSESGECGCPAVLWSARVKANSEVGTERDSVSGGWRVAGGGWRVANGER